jgi:hypothetical protein
MGDEEEQSFLVLITKRGPITLSKSQQAHALYQRLQVYHGLSEDRGVLDDVHYFTERNEKRLWLISINLYIIFIVRVLASRRGFFFSQLSASSSHGAQLGR